MARATPPRTQVTAPRRLGGRRLRDDGGSVSLEVAILFPALLLVITVIVQYGLWFHARSVALAAAQEGVAAAVAYDATAGAGTDRARLFLADHGETLLDAEVQQSVPGAGFVAVTVTGRVVSLVPGLAGVAVTQSAQGPVERFTVAGGP